MPTASPWIIETTAETFEQDVVERSKKTLVVVGLLGRPMVRAVPGIGADARKAGPGIRRQVRARENRRRYTTGACRRLFGVQSIPACFRAP